LFVNEQSRSFASGSVSEADELASFPLKRYPVMAEVDR